MKVSVLLLLAAVSFSASKHTQPECPAFGSGDVIPSAIPPSVERGQTGVRLVGGCSDGRSGELQVRSPLSRPWRTACYDTLDYFDAQFACNLLGFHFVEAIYEISSPSVSLGVEYDCTARDLAGGVSEILFCSSGYLEVESCSSYAGIVCDATHPPSEGYVALVAYSYGAKFDIIAPEDRLFIENCNMGYSACHGVYFANKNNNSLLASVIGLLADGPIIEGGTQYCGDHGNIEKFGVSCLPVPGDPVLTIVGSNTIWTDGLVWYYHEDHEWLNVCSDGMGYVEAQVLCNSIGFPYFSYLSHENGEPGAEFVIYSIECTGSETRIADCLIDIVDTNNSLLACDRLATVGCAGSLSQPTNDSAVLIFESIFNNPPNVANALAYFTLISPRYGLYLTNCSTVVQLESDQYCPGVHLVSGNNTGLMEIYNMGCQGIRYQLFGELCDPQTVTVTTVVVTSGQEGGSDENSGSLALALSVSGVVLFLVVVIAGAVACYVVYRRISKNRTDKARKAIIKDLEERHTSTTSSMGAVRYIQIRRNHKPIARRKSSAPQQTISNEQWEIPIECITLGEELGSGAYGVICKGVIDCSHQEESVDVAVKLLKTHATESERRSLLQEIDLMKDVGYHRHVISMLACCTKGSTIALVMEFMPFGNLQTFLKKRRDPDMGAYALGSLAVANPYVMDKESAVSCSITADEDLFNGDEKRKTSALSVTEQLQFGRQIALGMEYLSGLKVIHRDLATRNVLIDGEMFLKVSDFGLSRDIYSNDAYHMSHNKDRLPVRWMAIESVIDREFSFASDVWSFGVVLWEIVTCGSFPYYHMSNSEVIEEVRNGYRLPKPRACSDELYDIMIKCWRKKPSERPTFADLRTMLDALLDRGEYTRLM